MIKNFQLLLVNKIYPSFNVFFLQISKIIVLLILKLTMKNSKTKTFQNQLWQWKEGSNIAYEWNRVGKRMVGTGSLEWWYRKLLEWDRPPWMCDDTEILLGYKVWN